MISKLKNSEEIKKILRKRNKKVVLCHGTFDLLHLGHINHLSEAKALEIFSLFQLHLISSLIKGLADHFLPRNKELRHFQH